MLPANCYLLTFKQAYMPKIKKNINQAMARKAVPLLQPIDKLHNLRPARVRISLVLAYPHEAAPLHHPL